jgi:hypothetical protein
MCMYVLQDYLYVLEDRDSQASVLWFLNVATPQVGVAKMQLTGIPQCLAVYSAQRTPNTSSKCSFSNRHYQIAP